VRENNSPKRCDLYFVRFHCALDEIPLEGISSTKFSWNVKFHLKRFTLCQARKQIPLIVDLFADEQRTQIYDLV
jgi:hypothetical protein